MKNVPESEPKRPTGVFVGLATLDVIHRIAQPPGPNEKITSLAQFVAAGGPAANAAVTFAALGGDAILVTALGDGPVAELIRADLAEFGVSVVDAAVGSIRTVPVSAVSVVDATGDRSVVSADGVDSAATPPDDLTDVVAKADVVLVDGHHPLIARAAAECAAAREITVVVDAGRWKPVMEELIPFASDMVCSDDFRMPGSEDTSTTATALVSAGVRIVVTTHGGAPVEWWSGEKSGSVPVEPVTVVDTLGAGDAFHGAYSYFCTQQGSSTQHDSSAQHDGLVSCIDRAARVAALRCSVVGPRAWLHRLPAPQTWK
ncbi:PfkB family carbohydrate kinase [Rhodococcus sovatensis]|uniref:PfkB family carbohydrate kinase n=1 Tax=Rhodococcus sovatensis TaxID=1805840 RepID=A0ABZ2PMW8_9NOCA